MKQLVVGLQGHMTMPPSAPPLTATPAVPLTVNPKPTVFVSNHCIQHTSNCTLSNRLKRLPCLCTRLRHMPNSTTLLRTGAKNNVLEFIMNICTEFSCNTEYKK